MEPRNINLYYLDGLKKGLELENVATPTRDRYGYREDTYMQFELPGSKSLAPIRFGKNIGSIAIAYAVAKLTGRQLLYAGMNNLYENRGSIKFEIESNGAISVTPYCSDIRVSMLIYRALAKYKIPLRYDRLTLLAGRYNSRGFPLTDITIGIGNLRRFKHSDIINVINILSTIFQGDLSLDITEEENRCSNCGNNFAVAHFPRLCLECWQKLSNPHESINNISIPSFTSRFRDVESINKEVYNLKTLIRIPKLRKLSVKKCLICKSSINQHNRGYFGYICSSCNEDIFSQQLALDYVCGFIKHSDIARDKSILNLKRYRSKIED